MTDVFAPTGQVAPARDKPRRRISTGFLIAIGVDILAWAIIAVLVIQLL